MADVSLPEPIWALFFSGQEANLALAFSLAQAQGYDLPALLDWPKWEAQAWTWTRLRPYLQAPAQLNLNFRSPRQWPPVEQWTRLEKLDLRGNQLKTWPSQTYLHALKRLVQLQLSHNNLAELPPNALKGLSDLHTLNLSNNQLNSLDGASFRDLIQLKNLYLEKNPLTHLGTGIFAPLKQLRSLRLSQTNLSYLSWDLLEHQRDLRELSLIENKLNHLPFDFFRSLVHLRELRLWGNAFALPLQPKLFEPLLNLEVLQLDLAAFNLNLLGVLPKLKRLRLHGLVDAARRAWYSSQMPKGLTVVFDV